MKVVAPNSAFRLFHEWQFVCQSLKEQGAIVQNPGMEISELEISLWRIRVTQKINDLESLMCEINSIGFDEKVE